MKRYSPEYHDTTRDQAKFLDHLNLPTSNAESRDSLCRPITKEKVLAPIKSLPSGKAPGAELYKKMDKLVVEPLTSIYKECFDAGHSSSDS